MSDINTTEAVTEPDHPAASAGVVTVSTFKLVNPLLVLVACECSGAVRDAFIALGHDAWSCDLQPSETPGNHYQCDVLEVLHARPWDVVIGHPPCTYLTVSGNRWFKPEYAHLYPNRKEDRENAVKFFMEFAKLTCAYAIENPVGIMSTVWRKPDQVVHPYWFGDGHSKATCLWLNKLKPLKSTFEVSPLYCLDGQMKLQPMWHYETRGLPADERKRLRSKTFQGIADAMAMQWGGIVGSPIIP